MKYYTAPSFEVHLHLYFIHLKHNTGIENVSVDFQGCFPLLSRRDRLACIADADTVGGKRRHDVSYHLIQLNGIINNGVVTIK